MRRVIVVALTVLWLGVLSHHNQAAAQGLIWSLPADGSWVRYEGTYKQVEFRPNSSDGDITIQWDRQLTIKSVGQETAEYDGKMVPCRWVELKVETGKVSEAGIDPGPVGVWIYKVLIPEHRVIGDLKDDDTILVSYLPIVKGYRQTGKDGKAEEITSKVLQVYPAISLLRHYRSWESRAEETENNPQGGVSTVMKLQGAYNMESPISRSVHQAQLWTSGVVPFGLSKWTVKIVREEKQDNQPRSAFKPISEITVEMKAQQTGGDARSELNVP